MWGTGTLILDIVEAALIAEEAEDELGMGESNLGTAGTHRLREKGVIPDWMHNAHVITSMLWIESWICVYHVLSNS